MENLRELTGIVIYYKEGIYAGNTLSRAILNQLV